MQTGLPKLSVNNSERPRQTNTWKYFCRSQGQSRPPVLCSIVINLSMTSPDDIKTLGIQTSLSPAPKGVRARRGLTLQTTGQEIVRGKNSPRSGKCQGILSWIRENWHFEETSGKIEIVRLVYSAKLRHCD